MYLLHVVNPAVLLDSFPRLYLLGYLLSLKHFVRETRAIRKSYKNLTEQGKIKKLWKLHFHSETLKNVEYLSYQNFQGRQNSKTKAY